MDTFFCNDKTVPLAALRREAALTDGGNELLAAPDETLTVATLEGRARALGAEIDRIGKYDVPGLKEAKAELDRGTGGAEPEDVGAAGKDERHEIRKG